MQDQLKTYIENARSQNLSDIEIQTKLLAAGWEKNQFSSYFTETKNELIPPPPPTSKGSHTLWDTFQHVLLFISLYVYTTSFSTLIHTFVDRWIEKTPDRYSYYSDSGIDSYVIRMAAAALIVSFPIFAYLFVTLHQKTLLNPQLRSNSTRKKLIYFTLIVTFIIGIFEIGRTIFTLLGGNTTLNFLAHFLVSITVVSIIFVYYLNEVKEDRKHQ